MFIPILCVFLTAILTIISFYFDGLTLRKVYLSVVFAAVLQVILFLNFGNIHNIEYSCVGSFLFTAAYTDFREKRITNFNIYAIYVCLIMSFIVDLKLSDLWSRHIVSGLIALTVSLLLYVFKKIGQGDIPLIIALAYFLDVFSIPIFALSLMASILIFFLQKIITKSSSRTVAYAPGIFIAFIAYLMFNQFFMGLVQVYV